MSHAWAAHRHSELFDYMKEARKQMEYKELSVPHVITHKILFTSAAVALFCTRMFTRPSEQFGVRLGMAVDQATQLFDAVEVALAKQLPK